MMGRKKYVSFLLALALLLSGCTSPETAGIASQPPSNSQTTGGTEGADGVEQLTYPFTVSAEVVACTLAADTPLQITSQITFNQEGTEVPSPVNPRPITGWDQVTLYCGGETQCLSVSLPKTVAGGTYDWSTGTLTATHILLNLAVSDMAGPDSYPGWNFSDDTLRELVGNNVNGRLSTLKIAYDTNIGVTMAANTATNGEDRLYIGGSGMTKAQWQEEYPDLVVQVCIQPATPLVLQLEPKELTVVQGETCYWSNCGTTTVSGISLEPVEPQPEEFHIPDYFKLQMRQTICNVRQDMRQVNGHGESFVFITDLHWTGNQKHSPALIQCVLDHTQVSNVICGGDLINEGTYSDMRDVMRDCVSAFQSLPVPVPILFGNHDDNKNNQAEEEYADRWFSQEEVYAMMCAQVEEDVTFVSQGQENTWYYDRAESQTRFIGFDTGNANGRAPDYSYLVAALESVPSGWHVIVIAHMFHQKGDWTGIGKNIAKLLDGYNAKSGTVTVAGTEYTFTPDNAQGHVELMIGGHAHYSAETVTDGGIPAVVTDTDSNRTATKDSEGNKDYTKGTVTEQCFDVVTVDYETGTVTCRRIGRGQDRICGNN